MASNNISLNTVSPYSFNEWSQLNTAATSQADIDTHSEYIKSWYEYNNKANLLSTSIIKEDYINLLKELTYFFTEEEKNLFLKDIDFNNDIEIIYAIPFFVKKLKEIALTISKKRTILKNNKNKYKSLGSNQGIEKLLYEYILTSHTKSIYSTQISISSLGIKFPELSAVKDHFSLEIEELYDPTTYFNVEDNKKSLSNIERLADNSLFNVLQEFINNIENNTAPLSAYSSYTLDSLPNYYNLINLNQKYIGNTVYGLTAIKYDNTTPDAFTNLSFTIGNNWFYWPSGETFTDLNIITNVYQPIEINNSVFVLSGTAASSYKSSDLFFVENRGVIKGAWLRGNYTKNLSGSMVMTALPDSIRSFIFPTPGYGLTTNLVWTGRVFDDGGLVTFNLLDPQIKTDIIKKYFSVGNNEFNTDALPINNTNLIYSGAYAGNLSLNSDCLLIRPGGALNDINQVSSYGVYNDTLLTQEAFLYKLTSTELIIDNEDNYILWPLVSYNEEIPDNIISAINITSDTCNNVYVGNINTNDYMVGAIAGLSLDTADVIGKIPSKSTTSIPTELAWFCGGSIKDLATYNSYSIPIYNTPATNCIIPFDGPIQSSLKITCKSNQKTSFVWCDIDTPADEVFKFQEHSKECKYSQTRHNYISSPSDYWTECTCKSVYFSPIGHIGDQLTDYNSSADILFADPQNLGAEFTITKWRDTRNFNYKTSPQFSYFKRNNNQYNDISVGWGEGTWKPGSGDRMILKTGRRYTYIRSNFYNLNETFNIPSFISYYPYKKIISSIQSEEQADIVLAIDISGSQFYSINKIKSLAKKIIELVNTDNKSQLSIVLFNEFAITAAYLTSDKQILIDIINDINIANTSPPSNIRDGLEVSVKLLQNIFGANQKSLSTLCNNLKAIISTPFNQIKQSNLPNLNSTKNIILISDGEENVKKDTAILYANTIKDNIKILSVDIGPNSITNNLMERIATNFEYYWNYEQALLQEDTEYTIDSIALSIVAGIYGQVASRPVWKKATLTSTGEYLGLNEISDMILRPGDILRYTRRTQITYDTFSTASGPYIINIPLYGWNYNTHSFDGVSPGAKPYWGKVYNYPQDGKFDKFTREIGGHITYYNDYIPVSHPEISEIILYANDYIEYRNKNCKPLIWDQPVIYKQLITEKSWKKLNICVQEPSLKLLFKNNSIDKIFEQTYEDSDIMLGTYNEYTPAYYCYYSRANVNVTQPLFRKDKQNITYSQITTGVVIEPLNAYANLNNTHYAIIAAQPNISNFITKEQVGDYLLPHTLGVPYYLGYGYTNSLNIEKLQSLSSTEILFLDPIKYTSNRGLTQKDQQSPFTTTFIDNTWLKENYNSGKKAGNIINAADYQKFVPYQSNYESYKNNIFGLSRQSDQFEFWSGSNYITWNNTKQYPLNYKKEPYKLEDRTDSLLVTDKKLVNWQTDIYGNNYGLYKNIDNLNINKTQTMSAGEIWVRDINNNILPITVALSSLINNYIDNTNHYNSLTSNQFKDFYIFNNVILLQTLYGVSIDKFYFNIITSTYE